ncbi:4Fe-4S dicluster domain-containing protein [Thermodesulfobacterium sp. TA1]|uniref:[Fe-Fe] hydrogenase large subunit C-terminal domain-containing protein n=1 Tax=Thermodesulfobacterium sp. TA1 TaxID=2234087 RepID=UPI001231DCA8|nr:[Fe-Fe] hydrogenase large subunit C-terminal domain-containing protein [Thermodesulfobacterium sp. TA1]QER42606.1 4Fe-4S dicluster domain-containing protein [Thermodesulfobacterium sp. TA1]
MVGKVRTFKAEKGITQDVGTYRKGELKGILRINEDLCVGCDTCKSVCPAKAINGNLGEKHSIDFDRCIICGQCLVNCPFDAIEQMSFVDEVVGKLKDKQTKVVAIIAPAVRVAIAEEFGAKPGTLTVGKLWRALKKAGFEIYDNNFAADQTILEEGTELLARIAAHAGLKKLPVFLWDKKIELDVEEFKHKPLPQFTSCCPGWVRYAEIYYPDLLPYLSSCKSPQQMAGATAKTYGSKAVWKVSVEKIYTVGVMPCTAKIFEAFRPEFNSAGRYHKNEAMRDVDAVLTTRDLAEVFRRLNIDFMNLPEERFPKDFMWYSGGATIFGVSGGVMEAAVRFAFHVLSGKSPSPTSMEWEFQDVRGLTNPIVRATLTIPLRPEYQKVFNAKEYKFKVCTINGIGCDGAHLKPVLEEVLKGKSPYHFIEVMTCPGGCINGGGQPKPSMSMGFIQKMLYKLAKA